MESLTQLISVSKHLILLLMFVVFSSLTGWSQARDTTTLVRIETRDGNEYVGKIIESTADHFQIETLNVGTITIKKRDIVNIEAVESHQIKDNTVWFDNPQATRYLWAPNGFGLKRGEGYYQNIWVLFNHFSVGVTDNFSLGGGVVPLFLFAGAATPIWLTPKFSIPVTENKFNVGLGGLFGTVAGVDGTGFGLVYSHFTLGNRDRNVSLGLGWGYADGDWGTTPAISLSASIRTGPRGYFLTENYLLSGYNTNAVILSFAGRRLFKRTGLDYGLLLPFPDGEGLIAIPWLGLTIPFGQGARQYD